MFLTPDQERELQQQYGTNPHNDIFMEIQDVPHDEAIKTLRQSMLYGNNAIGKNVVDDVDWNTLQQTSPKTTNFLYDPMNMAVVRNKKNIEFMSEMEWKAKSWESFKNGLKGVGSSFLGTGLAMSESSLANTRREAIRISQEEGVPTNEQRNIITGMSQEQTIQGLEKHIEALQVAIKAPILKRKEIEKEGLGEEIFYGILETAPQVAAQVATYALTGPVGAGMFMGSQITGSQYIDLRNKGVAPERAFGASITNAAMQVPLEQIGLGKVFKAFPKGSTAAQKAMSLFERSATEAATEFLQAYPESYTNIVALNPDKTTAEHREIFIKDFVETTKQGLLEGAIAAPFGLIGGAGKLATQKEHTNALVEHIEQVQTSIVKSELATQSPEIVEKHLNEVYAGEKVYIDPQGFALYQSENPDVNVKLGITKEEVQSALETNEMIEVDFAKYTVATAQDPAIHQALKEDIAPEETGVTQRIIQERGKMDVAKATEQIKQQDKDIKIEADKAYNNMLASGVEKSVAKNATVLLTRHASTMSDNPAQWLRDNAPVFQGGKQVDLPTSILAQGMKNVVDKGKQLFGIDNKISIPGLPSPETLKQGVKGAIQWQEGRAVITLFENSDASTVVHEMVGHYFIQNLIEQGNTETATDQMQQDRKTSLEWAGITNWETATQEQKIEAHEKLAKAAERYLREGVAPTNATRRLFKRFKDWLTRVYSSIEAVGVDINDEIRGVFDRMIITQDEILEQEVLNNYHQQLPADVLDTLTGAQRNELDKAILDAREKAESQLRGKLMRFMSADNKVKMAEERGVATERIAFEVANEKLYIAEEKVKQSFKREAKSVATNYNDGTLKYDKAEDVEFEYLAESYGYSSGSELAYQLINNNSSAQEVTARVNEHMKQFRDIITDKEALTQEAQESMYSDDGALVIAIEQQIIQEKLGNILDKQEAKRQVVQAREGAKRAAKEVLNGRSIEQATRLQSYISAERRAAERAAKAMQKGDMETAQKQKQLQLLNHAMVMESLRIKREYESINKYLRRQQKSDIKTWKKEEHLAQAADLLTRFGYSRPVVNKIETLEQWSQRMSEDMDTVSIAEWLMSDRTEKPRKLTINELKDVENAIRNIKRIAQTEDSFFRLFDKAMMNDTISQATGLLSGRKDIYIPAIGQDERSAKQGYLYSLKKITTMLRDMDGQDFGFFHELIYENVYDAQNKLSARIRDIKTQLDAAYSAYDKKERADMGTKQIFFPELGASITKEQLLQLAFNVGNKSSRDVLFNIAPVGLEGSQLWKSDDPELAIMGFLGKSLSKRDWNFVQNVWDTVNYLFADADAMHKEMSGFSMDKIEAMPFNVTLEDGSIIVLRGGYYPLAQDPRTKKAADISGEEPLRTEKFAMQIGTNKGYTHSRTGAKYPIKLTADTTFQHLIQVSHDTEFRPVITDLRRLVMNKEFSTLIKAKMGLEGYALIRDFVGAAANTRTDASRAAMDAIDRGANWLRRRTVIAQLMGRMSVTLQNLANPLLYGQSVDGFTHIDAARAFFKRGIFDYWPRLATSKAKEMRDFVFNKSQFMRDKMETPDFILHEVKDKPNALVEFFTMILAESDNLSNIPMWIEAYEIKINTGATEHDAVMYADRLIDNTTGSSRKIDVPRILLAEPVKRTIYMYKTFMLTQYNAWAREHQIFLKEKDVTRLVTQVAAKYLLFVITSAFLAGKVGGDDDDWEKKLEAEIINYPLGFFPFFGDILSYIYKYGRGIRTFNYRVTPVESAITDAIGAITTSIDVLKGKKDIEEGVEAVSKAAAYAVPYPDQFNDWFWNAYDIFVNDMKFEPNDIMKRRPKRER